MKRFATLVALAGLPALSNAGTINKAFNANALDLTTSWTGGVVPGASDIAAYTSALTGGVTNSVGAGVSFQGIAFTSNPAGNIIISTGTGSLTLGSSGIDSSLTNRSLTIQAPIILAADQTWTSGTISTNNSITASGVISGSGKLTIAGSTSNSPVLLSGSNTFTGGVVLNSGSLRLGSQAPVFSGSTLVSSTVGTGAFTINGGTLYGGGTIAPSQININNDFNLNVGSSTLNGRLVIGGGSINLGSQTRTITLGSYQTGANVLVSGKDSLRFALATNAPSIFVQNGSLNLVRDSASSPTANDYVGVTFGQVSTGSTGMFAAGTGFSVGDHVVTLFATGNPFGTVAGAQPFVTINSGGYLNLSDGGANPRSPTIRTLSGAGFVTNLTTAATGSTLTINAISGDSATFSGTIADGSTYSAIFGNTGAGQVSVTKTGAGLQVFSGNNTYSGATSVTAGTLVINGNQSSAAGNVTVTSATLAGGGTIGGAATLGSSSVLAPGTTGAAGSFARLSFSQSLTLASTTSIQMEISDLSVFDSINVTGALTLNGALAITSSNTLFGNYDLFDFASKTGNFVSVSVLGTSLSRTGDVWTDGSGTYSFDQSTGVLTVPEPSAVLLLGLALTTVIILRRRSHDGAVTGM